MPYSRARATSFSKNGRSTHCAVGFDGKLTISIRGFGERQVDRLLQRREEVDVGGHRHVADVRARDHRPVDVDRVAGIGHQHRVAAVQRRERKVRDALLRADCDDRLGFGSSDTP